MGTSKERVRRRKGDEREEGREEEGIRTKEKDGKGRKAERRREEKDGKRRKAERRREEKDGKGRKAERKREEKDGKG
jgi:hypothetical protein